MQIDKLYLEGESSKIHLFPAPHFHEDKFREGRAITKDEDYLQNPVKQAQVHNFERQIDQMVYKLYNLTSEEIALVEGEVNCKIIKGD